MTKKRGKPRRKDVTEMADLIRSSPGQWLTFMLPDDPGPKNRKAIINSLRRTHFPDGDIESRSGPTGTLYLRLKES